MENNDQNSIKALCSNCNHQSCCTGFDSAIVFPEDQIKLVQIKKTDDEYLEDIIIAGVKVKRIRKNSSNQCIFWKINVRYMISDLWIADYFHLISK